MVNILHNIHYQSVEHYLLNELGKNGSLVAPKSFKVTFPNLYLGINKTKMLLELIEIMNKAKLLNVLTFFLYYIKDYSEILDDVIDETLALLNGGIEPRPISNREAYYAIVAIIENINPGVIADNLRTLNPNEEKTLVFLLQMRNILANLILTNEKHPYKDGEII